MHTKRIIHLIRKKFSYTPYLFIAPFFIIFLIFSLFPTLFTLVISFFEWDGFGEMNFARLDNYGMLLNDPVFHIAVINTFKLLFVILPIEVGIALVIANILNTMFSKIKHYIQSMLFMPYITSPVAIAIMFGFIFSYRMGLMNQCCK